MIRQATNLYLLIISLVLCIGCQPADENASTQMKSKLFDHQHVPAPIAKIEPQELTAHGDTRTDNYYWLREREDQSVIDYLNEENAYTEQLMAHNKGFQAQLYEEMVARIKKDDSSVPYLRNGYYYQTKYHADNEYPLFLRSREINGKEELLIDQNKLAAPYSYHDIRGLKVSPDNRLLVYGEDTLSRRIYTLKFKNLETGDYFDDVIPNTSANAVWANDNRTLFYTVKDETLRPFKVFKHIIGTDVADDVLVYHEKDPTFYIFLERSNSNRYLFIGCQSTTTTEYHFLNADQPDQPFQVFHPRERNLEYDIEHSGDQFYILTNKDAQNFQVMVTSEEATRRLNWKTIVPYRRDVLVEDMDVFKDFLVVTERHRGITKLHVIRHDGEAHFIDFDETVYTASTRNNYDYDTDILRLQYTSLKTPMTTYDYNMSQHTLTALKQVEVLGSFDSDNYETKQVQAKARDGKLVPVSLVYRKEFIQNGTNPIFITGYGSYGHSYDPYFSSVRLSLLDRGFVFAIAHIRGGEELGRPWYEDGKLFNKKNTFNDFVDCAEYLISEKYADPKRVFINGGSAGGLLMGAVTNMRPDLWAGVVSDVPFVDVVTTMMDESIPLTTGEYDEWGNPNDSAFYQYMKSYSPYDNLEAKEYPPILVTTGLHDSQVQYWEPAKYVARMRALKTDKNPLLLHTDMEAGHGGASGRFSQLKEVALQYAFVLDLANEMQLIDKTD